MARKVYCSANGYHYVECTECGAKFNAGRASAQSGRLQRLYESMDEWWAYHTGTIKMKYCKEILPKDKIPKLCERMNGDVKEEKEKR